MKGSDRTDKLIVLPWFWPENKRFDFEDCEKIFSNYNCHFTDDRALGESYFLTISSCKFYLSFENSIHRDYITETFSGPLTAGIMPIMFGLPRSNYEDFAPGTSFLHVNEFPDTRRLAEFSLGVDKDNEAFMRYFKLCRFLNCEFVHTICQDNDHVGITKDHRAVPDVYKWFFP
ncbi:4-galactosyl-N-acetylglucosaminide 3-alpha-L-fucosyltransferase 9-like [Scomber japonicus]|uniref:4-galactosyl-N-acetylglucosaminide 3-alpha-L-fucosyltransferase 9-like n=1 Tax=Scomber japonicus TaxID=13676 RepID=UPI002306B889|nr:4-galactosyl-N-acetylglucosaminide 3-alpha-L-fucosyltransferase 9-like [Scomber japonicus]